MFCSKCGCQLPEESKFCSRCGVEIIEVKKQAIDQKTVLNNNYQITKPINYSQNGQNINFANATGNNNKKDGFGIAALILGILSIIFSFTVVLSIIMGILAIIFGILQLTRKSGKGISIAGIITGAFGIIITVIFILCISYFVSKVDEYDNGYSYDYNFNYDNGNYSDYSDEYDNYDDLDIKGQNLKF